MEMTCGGEGNAPPRIEGGINIRKMNEKTKLNSNMQYPKFKVTVQCATFQHVKYITDAMNGFTMQQTDFPFVCTIIDDASTDGEQAVISNYLDTHFDLSEDGVAYKKETDYAHIIYARHKTNKNCYFAVLFLKENHYSQGKDKGPYIKEWRENVDYIALCEGDDYWIDPLKLQKQVETLDENTESSFVYTGFNVVDMYGKILRGHHIENYMNLSQSGMLFFDLLVNHNYIMTLTTLFRTNVANETLSYYYDYGFFLNASRIGTAIYLPEKMANYRINPQSIMNTNPWLLYPIMCRIVANEINRSIYSNTTLQCIKRNSLYKTVLGYVIAKNIVKSTCKFDFFRILRKKPQLLLYTIKGVFIILFTKKQFKKKIKITICK